MHHFGIDDVPRSELNDSYEGFWLSGLLLSHGITGRFLKFFLVMDCYSSVRTTGKTSRSLYYHLKKLLNIRAGTISGPLDLRDDDKEAKRVRGCFKTF